MTAIAGPDSAAARLSPPRALIVSGGEPGNDGEFVYQTYEAHHR